MANSNFSHNQETFLRVFIDLPKSEAESAGTVLWESGTLGFEEQQTQDRFLITAFFPYSRSAEQLQDFLISGFESSGVRFNFCVVETFDFDDRQWLKPYREYFKPFPIGTTYYVYPPWEKPSPDYPVNLLIEPGHGFGTGTHESTQLSLLLLESVAGRASSILDFGTGSGILAVAARMLNHSARITAFDIDPMAVECAVKTISSNAVGSISCFAGASSALTGRYELTVANLTANIHRSVSEELRRLTEKYLILAGITSDQKWFTLDAFEGMDFEICNEMEENGWMALLLELNSK